MSCKKLIRTGYQPLSVFETWKGTGRLTSLSPSEIRPLLVSSCSTTGRPCNQPNRLISRSGSHAALYSREVAMQEREKEQETRVSPAPADPKSEPLLPVPLVQVDETDDDPDTIFIKTVAKIDTQPLLQKKKIVLISFLDVLQVLFCSCLILGSLAGIRWQAITYPQTVVILYTVEKPASLTVILDVPTRTLAPLTLTRGAPTPTTA